MITGLCSGVHLKKCCSFFLFPPTGLSIDNCSKLQQRKTCFQSAVLFFCFSGNTVQKPEIRLRMSEVRLVLDLSVYLRWESFFLASSHICTFFQSGWFWKIYPEVTIQDQWNGVAMLADVLTPYPVCLSRSVTLDISSINTHTRSRTYAQRAYAFSRSNEYCVVRSYYCVSQFMGLLAFKWPFKMFCWAISSTSP